MKNMIPLCALLLSLSAHAQAHAQASPCETLAQEQVQGNFDAYVSLAKRYPGDVWDKYLACEGQKVKLEAVRIKPLSPEAYLYLHDYSIRCGRDTLRATSGFIYKFGRCAVSGE